jgi:hypothetical protein
VFRFAWRLMRPLTPDAVVRRLRRSETQSFSDEIRGVGWAWDPRPDVPRGAGFNRAYGRGRVTYAMDPDGVVHFTMARPDGRVHESQGPLPRRFVPGTAEAARARRVHRYLWAALSVYPLGGVVGFVIGYNMGSEVRRSTMVGHGFIGFFAGYLGAWFVLHIAVVIVAVRHATRRQRRLS